MRSVVLRSALLGLGVALMSACATVDVYRYQARALPAGVRPLDAVLTSLNDLRGVNWGTQNTPYQRRARVGADARGLAVAVYYPADTGAAIYLTYSDISQRVRAVVHYGKVWTVLVGVSPLSDVELQFNTVKSARMFLDAATAMAGPTKGAPAGTPVATR
jgi:hypothetical protein